MKEIKLKPNMHFIVEVDDHVSQEHVKQFTEDWNKAFLNHYIFFIKKDRMTIIEDIDK